ncbi:type II toxin-antitoxin system RelE/ParE family toxin [Magnetovirga frankeli]|uniref:type II toxin-antitoxin system RelE/ParE family toxin n=1 Tax=Magnetovirga frankeli TaxID=947516 RepID=UPI001293868D|nr:type II toxin-antitoxin system RelE/ParE family toxin [gamma proteobacterium SS-5]
MQVKWLRTALLNLEHEAEYIRQDNPAAARLIVQRVRSAVSKLQENPAMGRPGRITGTRELVVPDTRYIIPYRVRHEYNRIEILRVFHCSRKPPEHWWPVFSLVQTGRLGGAA